MKPARTALLLGGILLATAGTAVAADPPPPPGWYSTSGRSLVLATGNSRTSTLVTDRFGWMVGGEFERDRFSGLKGRTLGQAGVRHLLANRKDFVFKTGLAATVTHQSEVVDDPTTGNTFVGLRLSADAERKLGANDHQPSLVDLPLFERDGTPTGLSVFTEAAALDTTFTVSVVVSFAPPAATT